MIGVSYVGSFGATSTGSGSAAAVSILSIGRQIVGTSGVAVALVATSTPCQSIIVCGDVDAGIVTVIGDSNVVATTTGINGVIIIPGNSPVTISSTNAGDVYVDAQENGGAVSFVIIG